MFSDLYKNTPVFDCPNSHAEVEKTLSRLREITRDINEATSDRQTQTKIQRAWKLQDLLVFPDTVSFSCHEKPNLVPRANLRFSSVGPPNYPSSAWPPDTLWCTIRSLSRARPSIRYVHAMCTIQVVPAASNTKSRGFAV